MSTITANNSAVAFTSNQELWELLMDVSNVKDNHIEKIAKTLFDAGVKGHDDLDILANLPKVLRNISECLKDVPAKKFDSEMKSRSVLSKAPFCPICRDAGLTAEDYTSHHIWADENREVVICPTLLSHTCEICGETGHMPRYCKASRYRNTKLTKPLPSNTTPTGEHSAENENEKEKEKETEKEKPKHCKVCYQAGFSADIYSSHFTKVDDQILCPTILNNTCLRCGKNGHTPKYCTITVRQEPTQNNHRRKPSRFEPPSNPAPTPAPIPLPSYIPPSNTPSNSSTHHAPRRILSRKEPLPIQPPSTPLTLQQLANKFGDTRYEHDELGRPDGLTVWATDFSPPATISFDNSQEIIALSTQLLERAKNTKYTNERNALIATAIDYQRLLLNYPNL